MTEIIIYDQGTTCQLFKPRLCNRIRNEAIKHKEIDGYAKKHSTAMVMRIIKMKCLFHSALWM